MNRLCILLCVLLVSAPIQAQGPLFKTAVAAALLLTVLCAITASSGVSQQAFELVAPPADYARALVDASPWLRLLVALDDLFIVAYVLLTLFIVGHLAHERMTGLHHVALAAGVAAGCLDFAENHHLLAMLRWAEAGQSIPAEEILHRSSFSQLKWMLGHAAFVAIGTLLPASADLLRRVFRSSLLFVQLPIGVAAWTVADPTAAAVLAWARYGAFVSGFAFIAWFARVGFDEPARDGQA